MSLVTTIILAAGHGTRMHSNMPKVLHPICGRPMITLLLESLKQVGIDDITVVIAPDAPEVAEVVSPYKTVVQQERLGTAHAVLTAVREMKPLEGCVLILFGDSPLLSPNTIRAMIRGCQTADVVVLGFIPPDARRYGRLIMGENGLEAIVEYKDATEAQRQIKLCNSGAMCVNGRYLRPLLEKIKNDNAAHEYYLTDVVGLAREAGLKMDVVIGDTDELHGVNTPEELELAEELYIKRNGGVC